MMQFSHWISVLDEREFVTAIPDLATILVDAVESGASVGFELPFSHLDAERWWRSLLPDVAARRVLVLGLREQPEAVIGTAQLHLAQMPNQRHRADVAKVLVLRSERKKGLGTALMGAVESFAKQHGRTLLVLDTITGSDAYRMYERLGWTRAGEIPRYATMPDGTLAPTTYFYKELR